jgi:hypothetical protein
MRTVAEHPFGVRFQRELYEALLEEQERLRRLRPGSGTTFSDVVREVLWRALLREKAGLTEQPSPQRGPAIEETP